jgi:hypothetical protein
MWPLYVAVVVVRFAFHPNMTLVISLSPVHDRYPSHGKITLHNLSAVERCLCLARGTIHRT